MRITPIDGDKALYEVANAMLKKSLNDPAQRKIVFELINDPEVTRHDLFGTAFSFGVAFALSELEKGNIQTRKGN